MEKLSIQNHKVDKLRVFSLILWIERLHRKKIFILLTRTKLFLIKNTYKQKKFQFK